MKYSIITILSTFIFLPFFYGQGGLIIESGAYVVADNSPNIIVENGKFTNNGNFTADKSTVSLTGTSATEHSTIGGSSYSRFHHLTIDKSSNDTRLDYDIEVAGDLLMKGGNLILNYSDIVLGGSIVGEKASKRITGEDGGAIIKTVDLNMPVDENPGNIGVEITSGFNFGQTTIYRRHVALSNNGNNSIHRNFDIIPTNNTNQEVQFRIYYFDEELGGLAENSIDMWHFDGMDWTEYPADVHDMTNNWIETTMADFLYTVTLAEEMTAVLPVELMQFDALLNEQNTVDLFWTTASEINNDYFIVERSTDGIRFSKIDHVAGAGNSSEVLHYHSLDEHPVKGNNYYRLRQVDFDGSESLSAVKVINISDREQVDVYPNPMLNELNITGLDLSREETVYIQFYDAYGRLIYQESPDTEEKSNLLTIDQVAEFVPGNYFVLIKTDRNEYGFNLVKM